MAAIVSMHPWIAGGSVLAALLTLGVLVRLITARFTRARHSGLIAAAALSLAALGGLVAVMAPAHASAPFTLNPSSIAGDLEIGSSNYSTVKNAVNTAFTNGTALGLPVTIPDLQSMPFQYEK